MIKIKTGLALAALGLSTLALGHTAATAAPVTLEPVQSIASQAAGSVHPPPARAASTTVDSCVVVAT